FTRHSALCGLDLDFGVRQYVEEIALVRTRKQPLGVRAPRDGVTIRIDERDQVSALRLPEHADEVPALLPVDLAEPGERDGGFVCRGLPNGFAAREADGAVFLRDDLRDELREALHLARVRLRTERDVELLEAADRENALPDKLRERLLRLVVSDGGKVRLDFADEDGIGLNATVLELPLVEGQLPVRLVDDDAPRPLAWVIRPSVGEKVAEQV